MADTRPKGPAPADEAASGVSPVAEAADGSLDHIRSILFGQDKAEYERRLALIEAQLAEQGATFARELSDRLEAASAALDEARRSLLESLQAEREARTEGLQAEREARTEGLKQVAGDLKQATATFEKQLARHGADLTRSVEAIEARIAASAKSLDEQSSSRHAEQTERHEELRRLHDRHAETVAAEFARLNDAKAERLAIAALLREAADRLSQGLEPPQ